jgi:hypothetical protein
VFLRPQILVWLREEWRQIGPDLRRLLREVDLARLPFRERWALAGVMAFYLAAAVLISRRMPLRYDEAYTHMEFARHSFWQAISDYHVVNNHILNTLLVHLSTRLLGDGLVAIRLPAMTAGLLVLPGLYGLGRRLYNGGTGLFAAGLLSLSPVFLLYATGARGYVWVMLFTVWLLLLALRLQEGHDRAAWILLPVCGALGMWAIPIMIYPLAAVYVWLVAQAALQPLAGVPILRRLAGLASAGLVTVALTLLLYTPAFGQDWLGGFLVRNQPAALPLEVFYARLGGWVKAALQEWLAGFPAPVVWLLLAGLVLSLVLHGRRVPLWLAVLAALSGILAVQRPEPITRMWSWLVPLFFLGCAAGLAGGLGLFLQERKRLVQSLPAILLVFGLVSGGAALADEIQPLTHAPGYDAPQVTAYLQSILTEEDVVVVAPHTDALYWYAFARAGIPDDAIRGIKLRPFRRALVIVYPDGRETLESVLSQVGPDAGFLDLDTTTVLQRFPEAVLYAVEARHDIVKQAFP